MGGRFIQLAVFLLKASTIGAAVKHRKSAAIAVLSAVLCSACNDFEDATAPQSASTTTTDIAATVQALMDAGHPTLTPDNAKPVSKAPEGTGFTLVVTTNATDLTDSRLATDLNGEVLGENGIAYQTWIQREGPEAFILNANTANATALLPQVKNNTTLSFGWLASDTQWYVAEAATQVQLLGNAAPFSVTTRAQSELYSQVLLEVVLEAPATETIRLHYQTQNGTATANEDYLAMSGEVVFSAGQRSKLIPIPLLNDQNSAAPRNEGDEYFRVLVSGTVAKFTGTVHGYGVIYNTSTQDANTPILSASNTQQNTLMGTAGEQRAFLTRTDTGLQLSVNSHCKLTLKANCTEIPKLESGDGWQNIVWPTAPTSVQSYMLTNVTSAPIDYVVTFFDGSTTQQIAGTAPANQRINIYTANISASTANSTENISSSSRSSIGNNSSSSLSSSSAAPAPAEPPKELRTQLLPKGLDATELTLDFSFDNNIAIETITADLNGNALAADILLSIPYSQLNNDLNVLQVSASDKTGHRISRSLHLYLANSETNAFVGDGDINIFIGQTGLDTFTGGAGTNIYLAGRSATTYIGGSGENIFILQNGVSVAPLQSQGDFTDQVILPGVAINAVRVRQFNQNSFYLENEDQSFSAPNFFTLEGGIQSSMQRFIFADGELSATDIRQMIHAPSADDDNYWGFSIDDTIIDPDGMDNAFGGDGDDTLTVGGLAEGGVGNDTINANIGYGNEGDDTIIAIGYASGGEGNDTLQGATVEGDEGDDILTATGYANGGAGNDLITAATTGEGGDGDDEVHASSPFGNAGNDTLYTSGTDAFGGDGDDIIYGNELANNLFGDLGNDTLYGYGGNDGLFSGEGHSTLDGGDGDDELFAARGEFDDILIGGNGNDMIWGYDGNNTFDGGPGDETFFAGNGNNLIDCGEGTHSIFSNDGGNDTITCGSGDDIIHLAQGNDEVRAGGGNDQIYASGPSSNALSAEDSHAGNKYLLMEDGDDELRLSDGLTCHANGGEGNDLFYASCQQFTVDGGSGDDILYLNAFFQLTVIGGTGDDEFIIGRNSATPHSTLANDTAFLHYYWAPGDGNDTYQLSNMLPAESSVANIDANIDVSIYISIDERESERFDNSHFYLGGTATPETITWTQSEYASLRMHYHNPESATTEVLTFNNWFNLQTGLANGESFKDFQFPSSALISTQMINRYFNRFYHRNFDAIYASGLSSEGTPMIADQTVVSEQSLLVDNENYAVKKDHHFTSTNWTIEFWMLPPTTIPAITPILQWGEMPDGIDGFGLALHDNGEGREWRLQTSRDNSVSIIDSSALDNPVHIAMTHNNQQLTLFVNGQPSSTALTTNLPPEAIAPLAFGYFNISNANTAAWHLDELLISQDVAKYSSAFTPEKTPIVIELKATSAL